MDNLYTAFRSPRNDTPDKVLMPVAIDVVDVDDVDGEFTIESFHKLEVLNGFRLDDVFVGQPVKLVECPNRHMEPNRIPVRFTDCLVAFVELLHLGVPFNWMLGGGNSMRLIQGTNKTRPAFPIGFMSTFKSIVQLSPFCK